MGHQGRTEGSDWWLFTFSPYTGNCKWLQESPKNSVHKPVQHPPGGNISEQWLHWWWRWLFHFHMGCHLQSWWLHPKCLLPELQELGQKSPPCNRSCLAARSDASEKKSVFFAYLVFYYPQLTCTVFRLVISVHFKSPVKKKVLSCHAPSSKLPILSNLKLLFLERHNYTPFLYALYVLISWPITSFLIYACITCLHNCYVTEKLLENSF